ncbi:hypothetical protein EN745_18750 [Mesorhizobium sp. M4A.F.Ca.ET.022.05.2.1]|nr:hypothetical protein EN745_18750 [Mesorhizobium sp. M4A.F.Ca.ET.022.05.2.1]RWA73641.1 MAG: hypothetical protein EOQ29_04510 [Mesorhizobium sp.]
MNYFGEARQTFWPNRLAERKSRSMDDREKPHGKSGSVSLGPDGVAFNEVPWPKTERARERMIAEAFVRGCNPPSVIIRASAPSFSPFGIPLQNEVDHLDFTVMTSQGKKLMELGEVAPLKQHGGKFANAPRSLSTKEKTEAVVKLLGKKSIRQGGPDRFLVLYATEHGFKLDPVTIERLRRLFQKIHPNFERVYFATVHGDGSAGVFEIFPGVAHDWFAGMTDGQLDEKSAAIHPLDMQFVSGDVTMMLGVLYGKIRLEAQTAICLNARLDFMHQLRNEPAVTSPKLDLLITESSGE